MTNKQLKNLFLALNREHFDTRLSTGMSVRFVKDLIDEEDGGQLYGLQDAEGISISSKIKDVDDFVQIVLLHEMVHADINSDGHGIPFKARINRLFNEGAYDILL